MLVDNNVYKNVYKGNGSTTSFPISFPFLDNAHIQVLRSPDGVNEEVVPASEYTITGAGIEKGGTCTFKVAPPTGVTIAVMRNVPITQLYAYRELDNFPAESHEDALAKLTMIDQQQQELLDRSVKLPATDPRSPEEYAQELLGAKDEAEYWAEYAEKQAERTVQVPSETKVLASGSNTPRTLADRFADVVNVKDFGAKGDGVTDDYNAFYNAYAYLGQHGGGAIYAPRGQYVLGQALFFDRNAHPDWDAVSIEGAGMEHTTLLCRASNYGIAIINPETVEGRVTYQRIANLTLRGLDRATGKIGLRALRAAFLTLDHVRVIEFDTGIYFTDVDQFYANKLLPMWNNYGLKVDRGYSSGSISTQPNNHTYVACTIAHNGYWGATIEGGSCLNFIGGDVEQNGWLAPGNDGCYGLRFLNCGGEHGKGAVINGTYFECNHGVADIVLQTTTDGDQPPRSCVHWISADFGRNNDETMDTKNHIACLFAEGTNDQRVILAGCAFRAFWGYTAKNAVVQYYNKQPTPQTFLDLGSFYELEGERPRFAFTPGPVSATFYPTESFIMPAGEQIMPIAGQESMSSIWQPEIIDNAVIIPANGTYAISAQANFSYAFEQTKKLTIIVDGVTQATNIETSNSTHISVSITRRLLKGSAVSVTVGQWSGTDRQITGAASSSTGLTITRIY